MESTKQKSAETTAARAASRPGKWPTAGKPPFQMPTVFPRGKGHAARNPKAEHREAQRQRADDAVRLAEKYPQLKSLKVTLEFLDREGMTKRAEMKYSANLEHAKSVLVFVCPISECCGGDFDLTAKLAEAVGEQRTKVTGEVPCLGSHKKPSGELAPCRSLLRYTLNLAYSTKRTPSR